MFFTSYNSSISEWTQCLKIGWAHLHGIMRRQKPKERTWKITVKRNTSWGAVRSAALIWTIGRLPLLMVHTTWPPFPHSESSALSRFQEKGKEYENQIDGSKNGYNSWKWKLWRPRSFFKINKKELFPSIACFTASKAHHTGRGLQFLRKLQRNLIMRLIMRLAKFLHSIKTPLPTFYKLDNDQKVLFHLRSLKPSS